MHGIAWRNNKIGQPAFYSSLGNRTGGVDKADVNVDRDHIYATFSNEIKTIFVNGHLVRK